MTFRFATALAWLVGPVSTSLFVGFLFFHKDHADPWAVAVLLFGACALIADAWLIARYLI